MTRYFTTMLHVYMESVIVYSKKLLHAYMFMLVYMYVRVCL